MWKCFSLASFSVLVNGVPKGHFGCSRGLRQGDLLSSLCISSSHRFSEFYWEGREGGYD